MDRTALPDEVDELVRATLPSGSPFQAIALQISLARQRIPPTFASA